MLRVVQLQRADQTRCVAVVEEPHLRLVRTYPSVYALSQIAIDSGQRLRKVIETNLLDERLDYDSVYRGQSDWRLLPPIDHPEPSRCFLMGTGLTHKGSAANRQSMHEAGNDPPSAVGHQPSSPHPLAPRPQLTDSMKMFQLGLAGGRPKPGEIGAAPEWFYKGVGSIVRAPNEVLSVPSHALDGGEEAEIAGVYLIGGDGAPFRIGMTQGNEFSDHVLESKNYLYLAESKLRDCAIGPELVVDPKFDDVPGRTSIERDGKVIWQAAQASGERWMCHSLANLEHHHFKHAAHRRPSDVYVHFLGADMFSFKDRLRLENGDVMQVSFEGFGRPLRNSILVDRTLQPLVIVESL